MVWHDVIAIPLWSLSKPSEASFKLLGFTANELAAVGALASAVAAICSLVIASLAPVIIEKLARRGRHREMKTDCFRRVVGLRSMPPRREWLDAIQEVPALFHGSKNVMQAYAAYDDAQNNSNLVALMLSMSADLGIRNLSKDHLLTVFNAAEALPPTSAQVK